MNAAAIDPVSNPTLSSLRVKIGWLCQIIRIVALIYAGWILLVIVQTWTNEPALIRNLGAFYGKDLAGMSGFQRAGGFAVYLAVWSPVAGACYCVWRLFSSYLDGRIFTVDATIWLRRVACFGFASQFIDLAARPLVSLILTAHLPQADRVLKVFFSPQDLLHLLFFAGLFALAHVFKTAAEIAEDNAAIV